MDVSEIYEPKQTKKIINAINKLNLFIGIGVGIAITLGCLMSFQYKNKVDALMNHSHNTVEHTHDESYITLDNEDK